MTNQVSSQCHPETEFIYRATSSDVEGTQLEFLVYPGDYSSFSLKGPLHMHMAASTETGFIPILSQEQVVARPGGINQTFSISYDCQHMMRQV